jgi:hypothetical protein
MVSLHTQSRPTTGDRDLVASVTNELLLPWCGAVAAGDAVSDGRGFDVFEHS